MQGTLLPDWAHQFIVSEQRFADAYEQVSLQNKSRLKQCIACLHAWYGQNRICDSITQRDYEQGLQTRMKCKPRDWALIRIDQSLLSPAFLLATVLPPALAGVGEVLITSPRGETPYSSALLTACELSGLEIVLDCPEAEEHKLVQELQQNSPSGLVLSLQDSKQARLSQSLSCSQIPEYVFTPPQTAGIWIDEPDQWDLESFHFAYPQLRIEAWSELDLSLPSDWSLHQGSLQDLLHKRYDLLCIPRGHLQTALAKASVILGPGLEGSWFWPDFCWSICFSHHIAWLNPLEQAEHLREPV